MKGGGGLKRPRVHADLALGTGTPRLYPWRTQGGRTPTSGSKESTPYNLSSGRHLDARP